MSNAAILSPSVGNQTVKGVLLFVAFAAYAPAIDVFGKLATEEIPAAEITFARFLLQTILLAPIVLLRRAFVAMPLRDALLHAARGILMAVATVFFFEALRFMPIADAISIFFVEPFLLILLGAWLLGEKVGWRRWAAVGVGLCGMLMILRPGAQVLSTSMGIAIVAMIGFVIYGLATRKVARTDGAMTSFYYTGLFGAITMTFIGPFFWEVMTPTDSVLMLILCATGMTGHLMLIKAFEAAEAAAIQPFAYLQTVFAGGIGVLWFGEALSLWTVAGSAVVISAGLFALWREQVAAREGRA